ncbi:MAG: site-2 protease family protein [Eubacterium sp.]|nr:site-2 protease family protein [Eubacterium sp.]
MSIGSIVLAILVFSVIIIFHEFGHFIVAKANHVGVIEFSLGMGPRILSWAGDGTKHRLLIFKSTAYFEEHPEYDEHTIYSWKILPFGGSCMMLGEEEDVDDERSFSRKSVWARMAIIFAGPFFNFILAFILSLIVIGGIGHDPAVITGTDPGSPAAEAGLQEGDVIKEMGGSSIVVNREISYYPIFHKLDGSPVHFVIERDGKEMEMDIAPKLVKQEDGSEKYQFGFFHSAPREKVGFLGTLKYSAYEVKFWIDTTIKSLGLMITGQVSTKQISGPVGIVQQVGQVVEESRPDGVTTVVMNLLMFSILITANLGVMNLLPIPALDGGRLLFLIIELIRRKPLPRKVETYVNVGGFAVLMALMVFILANDIIKLF